MPKWDFIKKFTALYRSLFFVQQFISAIIKDHDPGYWWNGFYWKDFSEEFGIIRLPGSHTLKTFQAFTEFTQKYPH